MQRLPPTLNYNTESADGEEKRPPHIHIYAFSEITPVSSGGKKKRIPQNKCKNHHKNTAKPQYAPLVHRLGDDLLLPELEESLPRAALCFPPQELCLGLFLDAHRNKHLCPLSAAISGDVTIMII